MKRQHNEERDNDIRATDCLACGAEGYTRQSGGDIDRFDNPDGSGYVEVCETCLEDFHRYGLVLPDNDSPLTPEQWAALRGYINTERKERDDETLVPELAREFCRILTGFLTPEQLADAVRLNATEPPGSDICHSHDFCDANVAMVDAWDWMFGKGQVPALIEMDTTEKEKDRDAILWNTAWNLSKAGGFKV